MPEGPECRVVADVIAKGAGKEFFSAEIVDNGNNYRFAREGIGAFGWLREPWVLERVRTYGKLIRIDFSSVKEKEPWSILNTLGMTGSWSWNVPKHKYARINFLAADGQALSFLDIRNFGTFKILSPEAADENVKRIGWDLLVAPCPEHLWETFKLHKKITKKEVKPALLEQSLFSGLGNIYVSETLYRVGLHPKAVVGNILDELWNRINVEAHQVLQESYKLGGSSVETYVADGKEGKAQNYLKVYGRKTCPKGHLVKTIQQNQRTTWFCPTCQP